MQDQIARAARESGQDCEGTFGRLGRWWAGWELPAHATMDPRSGTASPPSRCRAVPPRRHRGHGRRHRRWLLDRSSRAGALDPRCDPAPRPDAPGEHPEPVHRADGRAVLAATCTVVDVPPLLRELLMAAVEFVPNYDLSGRGGHVAALLLHEVAALAPLPFHIGLPASPDLATLCRAYLAAPDVTVTNAAWAARTAVSERAFTRRFCRGQGRARPIGGPRPAVGGTPHAAFDLRHRSLGSALLRLACGVDRRLHPRLRRTAVPVSPLVTVTACGACRRTGSFPGKAHCAHVQSRHPGPARPALRSQRQHSRQGRSPSPVLPGRARPHRPALDGLVAALWTRREDATR